MKKTLFLIGIFKIASCPGALSQNLSNLPSDLPEATICVLSGTNIANALTRDPHIKGNFTFQTPFGTSPQIYYGEVEGVAFYHIPLHGSVPVSDTSELATNTQTLLRTWSALHQLGIKEVLGGATAGAINSEFSPGDWVIPHDLIDWNNTRPRSIAKQIMGQQANFIMPRMLPADDPDLHLILVEETQKAAPDSKVFDQGVIAQAAGGRFETAAEIRMMKNAGGDLVTMTVATEMAYARQLGMNYACIVGIVNPAEGLGAWDWNTLTNLYPQFHSQSVEIYLSAIPRIAKELKDKPRAGDALRIHPELEEEH